MTDQLRARWLGRVAYRDAHVLQRRLRDGSDAQYLLMCEHPHVFTVGPNGDLGNLRCDPETVGADLVPTDRGGDITYHGPGQLVGYPILNVAGRRGGGLADTAVYVADLEQVLIDTLGEFGLTDTGRLAGYPGVWVDADGSEPRKIAAIGVRLTRGRSMHGFALNVDPDLDWFDRIVPCGIPDKAVTSLRAEGVDAQLRSVAEAISARIADRWADGLDRADEVWPEPSDPDRPVDPALTATTDASGSTAVRLRRRLDQAGVGNGLAVSERKPAWLRAPIQLTDRLRDTRRTVRQRGLTTVCEEAGCPNLSECWSDGTATFMLNGERCTRACGFCLVDTRHPEPVDPDEPRRVAEAVAEMGLDFAVLTAVARDDLDDGGAAGFAATVEAIRTRTPDTRVEVLIPDCKGRADALDVIFASRPDVLNHNVETVSRLQRAVRPSASYARSLSVLARSVDAGLTTKSGLIVGMGETADEVRAVLDDLAALEVDIVTIGQYLRPTARHLPVERWWSPDELTDLATYGRSLGLHHVEATPLTRSSHHAHQAADAAASRTEVDAGVRHLDQLA